MPTVTRTRPISAFADSTAGYGIVAEPVPLAVPESLLASTTSPRVTVKVLLLATHRAKIAELQAEKDAEQERSNSSLAASLVAAQRQFDQNQQQQGQDQEQQNEVSNNG